MAAGMGMPVLHLPALLQGNIGKPKAPIAQRILIGSDAFSFFLYQKGGLKAHGQGKVNPLPLPVQAAFVGKLPAPAKPTPLLPGGGILPGKGQLLPDIRQPQVGGRQQKGPADHIDGLAHHLSQGRHHQVLLQGAPKVEGLVGEFTSQPVHPCPHCRFGKGIGGLSDQVIHGASTGDGELLHAKPL